jgi:DNA-binding IscR family transcriptional regulator
MDTSFYVASHLLGYLAWRQGAGDSWVSSEELGRSINTHSVVVRRVVSMLRSKGLIVTRRGAQGGCQLARPARAISLADAFEAVMSPDASLINFGASDDSECPVGRHIEAVLKEVVAESEAVFRRKLKQTSIEEFSDRVVKRLTLEVACTSKSKRRSEDV